MCSGDTAHPSLYLWLSYVHQYPGQGCWFSHLISSTFTLVREGGMWNRTYTSGHACNSVRAGWLTVAVPNTRSL